MAIRLSTGCRTGMANSSGLREQFEGGFIGVYSGGQPANADAAETGVLLVTIATTSGTGAADGIGFGTAAAGQLPKSAPVWSGVVGVGGVAGYFRLWDINKTTGSNSTARRIDGNVGVSGSDMVLSNTTLAEGATLTIDQGTFEEPAS